MIGIYNDNDNGWYNDNDVGINNGLLMLFCLSSGVLHHHEADVVARANRLWAEQDSRQSIAATATIITSAIAACMFVLFLLWCDDLMSMMPFPLHIQRDRARLHARAHAEGKIHHRLMVFYAFG